MIEAAFVLLSGAIRELSAALIVSGAILELSGFVLALADLRDAEKRIAEHERKSRDQSLSPSTLGGGAHVKAPRVIQGKPTIAKRLSAVEAAQAAMQEHLDVTRVELREEMRSDLAQAVGRAEQSARDADQALQKLVAAVSTGRRQKTGIILFFIGVVSSAAGGVLGLAS